MGDETAGMARHVDDSRALPPGQGAEAGQAPSPDGSPGEGWPERWRGHDLRRLHGAGLMALWVVFVAVLWVGQVRLVPMSTLEADLASGQVVGYREVVLDRDGDAGSRWTGRHVVDYTSVDDTGLLTDEESDTSARGNVAVGYWVQGPVAIERVVDPGRLGSTSPQDVVARLQAAGIPPNAGFGSEFYGRADRVGQLAFLLGVLTFGLIVAGPRPVRGTRWFWFWMLFWPLALGALAYAVVELVRPGRLRGLPPRPRRFRGGLGFIVGVLLAGVLAAGLTALADLAPVLLVRP